MLSWSINLFRIRGIQLAVHSTFFLMLAWRAYEGWQEAGQAGLIVSSAFTVLFFVCIVLHELGHSFTGMHFGFGVRRILLTPIGGMAEFVSIPRKPTEELLMTLAGPAVNFVIAGVLFVARLAHPGWFAPSISGEVLDDLLVANIYVALFNLVPVFPMDGGRIFRALMAYKFDYVKATRIASIVGKAVAVPIAGFFLYQALWADNRASTLDLLVPVVLFGFIYRMNDMEYRAVKRAAQEEAYWREIALRHAQTVPPQPEPPLLP